MLADVLEDEGHAVTVATDFWAGLGVLRSSLHPLIGIYQCDGSLLLLRDEHLAALAALAANMETLRRHAYVQLAGRRGPLAEPLERLRKQVHVETLPCPFELDDLLAAVNRAAAQLAERSA